MAPESRDIILSAQKEKALWQLCFTAAPERRREFEQSFPSVERKDQRPGPSLRVEPHVGPVACRSPAARPLSSARVPSPSPAFVWHGPGPLKRVPVRLTDRRCGPCCRAGERGRYSLRQPLRDSRKYVSSASVMPRSVAARSALRPCRNRCRQRSAVFR